MKTLTLAGLPWHAVSPSHYQQLNHPCAITFDGWSWLVAVRGAYGTREFTSRDEAAALIAQAFHNAAQECLG